MNVLEWGYKIMRYSFNTSAHLKEKDRGKWWLNNDLVRTIELEASNLCEALEKYREIVNDREYVHISKNAIHKKQNMYMDIKPGGPSKQIGYVITGSTSFERDNGGFVNKFIDLWIEIRVVSYPAFE